MLQVKRKPKADAEAKPNGRKDRSMNESQMKSVNSNNKFDRLISDNNKKIKLNSLDLINQTNMLNITPVTFASLYDPMDRSKIIKHNLIVLIDSGASHSMAKASLVMMYKNSFLDKTKPHIRLPQAPLRAHLA